MKQTTTTTIYLLLLLLSFLPQKNASAQKPSYSCDTYTQPYTQWNNHKKAQIKKYEQQYMEQRAHKNSTAISNIPVQVHVTTETDGSQNTLHAISEADVVAMLEQMNTNFEAAFLQFYLCGDINFIADSNLNDFDINVDDTPFLENHYTDNVVNILMIRAGISCGWAGGIDVDKDLILLTKGCASSSTVPTHEMGHYFGLSHTHNGQFYADDMELVDGSNCEFAGDAICDTPADPQLSYSTVNEACEYIGDETDLNGQAYQPLTNNFMSYGRRSCRDSFTPQQLARIFATFKVERGDLNCHGASVNFEADRRNHCLVPATVQFTDTSMGAISWAWDMDGDDVIDDVSQHPTYLYTQQGFYDVRLTVVTDVDGNIDTLTKVYRDYINVGNVITADTDSIKLLFKTDNIPAKNRWTFAEGENILFSDAYDNATPALQTFEYHFPVSAGHCYLFTAYNDFGTGLTFGEGDGYYALYDKDGNELVHDVAFHRRAETLIKIEGSTAILPTAIQADKVVVYPNPADVNIHIKMEDWAGLYQVKVYHLLGNLVYESEWSKSKNTIDTREWASGLYFVQVIRPDGHLVETEEVWIK